MLADYHIHTDFSDDSNYPLEEVIKDAIKLNIKIQLQMLITQNT